MELPQLPLQETLANLPPEWPEDPSPAIRAAIEKRGEKAVVIDDDPMGTQSVANVSLLTEWPVDAIAHELQNDHRGVFILTNSRSMPLGEAVETVALAGRNLREAVESTGENTIVISRIDSTLRGHYPNEVDALTKVFRRPTALQVIVPFFFQGGRYTIDDVHYLAEGDWLTPVGQTEFARDAAFGYSSSNVCEWVEEKTQGRILAGQVATVSLEDIRAGGPHRVAERLLEMRDVRVCFPNAASMRDIEVFTLGTMLAEEQGGQFFYRSSASFLQVRGGLESRPLLSSSDLAAEEGEGGLTVVGSHVNVSTNQVAHLLDQQDVVGIEVMVANLIDEATKSEEIARVAERMNDGLRRGLDVVVFTSRESLLTLGGDASLLAGSRISSGLSDIIHLLETRPRYLVAKGGITSYDIATRSLGVKRAMCIGQILPGVPVWELGDSSRFPGLKYVAFPGNIGDPDWLSQVVAKLRGAPDLAFAQ
ncbi:MAG: hypothetical protein F4W93_04530 [Dehalococcoidia bacterium]|nr:hypothetical protein [Dehalococcoidia bacterium]